MPSWHLLLTFSVWMLITASPVAVAELVLTDQLVLACSWGLYLNNLDTGALLVATPLPFCSFSCHLSWTLCTPKNLLVNFSSSLGGQRSRMGDQNSRGFYFKRIRKWNLNIKVFSNEKIWAGTSLSPNPGFQTNVLVREALVLGVSPHLVDFDQQHWPLRAEQVERA